MFSPSTLDLIHVFANRAISAKQLRERLWLIWFLSFMAQDAMHSVENRRRGCRRNLISQIVDVGITRSFLHACRNRRH